jgi:hypothetical protein
METSQREESHKGPHMSQERTTKFKRMRAKICHHCPVCKHTRRNPDSVIGRIHYKYHAENCPMWTAEREVYGEREEIDFRKVDALRAWKAL